MKKIIAFLLVILILCSGIVAYADIDWSSMTDEEINDFIEEAFTELFRRNQDSISIGEPIYIENEYGKYILTVDNAHVLTSDSWMNKARKRSEESVYISVQAVVENIDCDWLGRHGYIPNYQVQCDITVSDQDGFALEIYDISGGDDGRYEVGAHTGIGEKKRVSLIYYAFTDTDSVMISFPDTEGTISIPLK